jgi:zinc transport system ATP-binding protein
VPQNTDINISFPIRVFEVVLMGSKSRFGYSDKEKQEAIESLEKVGMSEFFESKIGNLSGGQRQRVLIARALYLKPKILLLDEPTSNIDTKGQKEIYSLLKELNKEITIIVVSHDISILRYTNKVAHINRVLTMHEAPNKKLEISEGEHFCEIELLEMIGKKDCKC